MGQNFFKDGFGTVLNHANSSLAAETGGEYVNTIQQTVEKGISDIEDAASTRQLPGIKQGFVSEEFHNLQAKLYIAKEEISGDSIAIHSNKLNSPDFIIRTPDGTEYFQVKYHNSAESTLDNLLHHNYTGMKIIVPWGQVDQIKALIDKKVDYLHSSHDPNSLQEIQRLSEIRGHVFSKLNADTHAISRHTSDNLTDKASHNNINTDKFHLQVIDNVDLTSILMHSLEAGAQASIINSVLSCAPTLCKEIHKSLSGQKFNGSKVLSKALDSAPKGFIRGTAAALSFNACHCGLLGEAFQNVSTASVSAVTVVALRTVDNAIDLFNGKITSQQFTNAVIKDSFVTTLSYLGSITTQALIPIPILGAAIGSIVGGIVANIAVNCFSILISNHSNILLTMPLIEPIIITEPIIIQDYTLPEEVLKYLHLERLLVKEPELRKPHLFEPELATTTLALNGAPFLKRRIISLNKEGYILYK